MSDETAPVNLTDLVGLLRKLCRHVDDGGAADYVRLATDDPMGRDENARPALAVPVADVENLLDQVAPALMVSFEEAVEGTAGRRETSADAIRNSLAELISSGRKTEINLDDGRDAWYRQYPDLDSFGRAPLGDPRTYQSVTYRTTPPARATVSVGTGGTCRIASYVECALRGRRGALTADAISDMIRHRVVGGAPLTRAETVAGLATLHAAGQCTVVNFGGPRYLASAWGPEPDREPALVVLIAEHLADVGPAGADVAAIAAHLSGTYEFGDGREPVPGRVIVAGAVLAERRLAIRFDGTYFAPQHAPI